MRDLHTSYLHMVVETSPTSVPVTSNTKFTAPLDVYIVMSVTYYCYSTSGGSDSGKVKVCSNSAYGVVSVAAEPEYEVIGLQQRN